MKVPDIRRVQISIINYRTKFTLDFMTSLLLHSVCAKSVFFISHGVIDESSLFHLLFTSLCKRNLSFSCRPVSKRLTHQAKTLDYAITHQSSRPLKIKSREESILAFWGLLEPSSTYLSLIWSTCILLFKTRLWYVWPNFPQGNIYFPDTESKIK